MPIPQPLYTLSFVMMALANFCTMSSFAGFFLFPLFIADHGGSRADIGIIMGAFFISSVFSRPWIAEMVDRIGRKRSYSIGSLIMTLLPLGYLTLGGDLGDFYLPLLGIRIIHGVGLAICMTAAFTYVADIVPAGRLNEGIGIFGVSGLTGLAFGPFVCEWLIQTSGFHAFFLAAAAMAGVGFLSHFLSRESRIHFSRDLKRSFFSVLRGRKMAMVAVLALLFGFGSAASGNFVSPLAQERHLTFISLYYIAYSSAAVLTRLFGARLADRLGEERILPYALTLTGVGLLTLILPGANGVLALSGLLSGCGHGFLYPCLNVLAVRGEPAEIRGKITGIFTGSIDAGAFIGSIILGQIGEWAGFPTLFLAAGLALLLGLGVFRLGR